MALFRGASSDMIDRMGKDLREEVRFVVAPHVGGASAPNDWGFMAGR